MNSKKFSDEQGFTLIEVLITTIIIAIVAAISVGLISSSQKNSEIHLATNQGQDAINYSVSQITRELSTEPIIRVAEEDKLLIDNNGTLVYYFLWQGEGLTQADLPPGLNTGALVTPDISAEAGLVLLEARRTIDENGIESPVTVSLLLNGVSETKYDSGDKLFSYYSNDGVLPTPVDLEDLFFIERVGIRVVKEVEGVVTPLELKTSMALTKIGGISTELPPVDQIIPPPPVLRGQLPPTGLTATLEWSPVAGALSYELYRYENNQGITAASLVATKSEGDTLSVVDSNRPHNTDSYYFVLANGPGGTSGRSNIVQLRTIPLPPAFGNIDANASCSGNTVARNLNNCLAWSDPNSSTGVPVTYDLSKRPTSTPAFTNVASGSTTRNYVDSNQVFGNVTRYRVVARNEVVLDSYNNPTGGVSTGSEVTLISPPVAPSLSGSSTDGIRSVTWNAVSNATAYKKERVAPSGSYQEFTQNNTRSITDSSEIDSNSFSYRVTSVNAAGEGGSSTVVVNGTRPSGSFAIGVSYTNGIRRVSWNPVENATSYVLTRIQPVPAGVYSGSNLRFNDSAGQFTQSGGYLTSNPAFYSSTYRYGLRACNITGCSSTMGNSPTVDPRPGQVSLSGQDYYSIPRSPGVNVINFSASNASFYRVNGTNGFNETTINSYVEDGYTNIRGREVTYYVEACNVVGCSPARDIRLRQP